MRVFMSMPTRIFFENLKMHINNFECKNMHIYHVCLIQCEYPRVIIISATGVVKIQIQFDQYANSVSLYIAHASTILAHAVSAQNSYGITASRRHAQDLHTKYKI